MPDDEKYIADLKHLLHDVVDQIGTLELPNDAALLDAYCRLTDHDYNFYLKNNLMPQGYVMTITIPLFQKLFIGLGAKSIPSIIRGVIHTSSVVEYIEDMPMNRKYFGKIGIGALVRKKGGKGEYFAVDILFDVFNDLGRKVAADNHQFFLKT